MAVRFPELSESDLIVGNCEKQTQSSNDKTIIELDCRKISCLAPIRSPALNIVDTQTKFTINVGNRRKLSGVLIIRQKVTN